jgi:hypothetical protein
MKNKFNKRKRKTSQRYREKRGIKRQELKSYFVVQISTAGFG